MTGRNVLSLKKPEPAAPVAVPKVAAAPEPDPCEPAADAVPDDASVSYVNWWVGAHRPSRRYLTAEGALTEAKRLLAPTPWGTVHTYELRLIGTGGEVRT